MLLSPAAAQGTCVSNTPNHSEMFDRFEGKLSPLWYKITGGQVGTGCGTLNDGRSLYFNGLGKREARTVPLDTRNIRQVVVDSSISFEYSGLLLWDILCSISTCGLQYVKYEA
jgi:reelin